VPIRLLLFYTLVDNNNNNNNSCLKMSFPCKRLIFHHSPPLSPLREREVGEVKGPICSPISLDLERAGERETRGRWSKGKSASCASLSPGETAAAAAEAVAAIEGPSPLSPSFSQLL